MKKIALVILIAQVFSQSSLAQTEWAIDKAHSNIRFSVMHYVITEVEGQFKEFDAKVTSNSADDFNGATIEFAAKVASIDTDNEKRDGHLKSDDFFNADKYPEIKFKGKLEGTGNDYELVGDFTMRDVTKPVRFKVKYNGSVPVKNGMKAGFKISGEVDRFEYGMKFDRALETGGLVVGQEVGITCNIELNQSSGS